MNIAYLHLHLFRSKNTVIQAIEMTHEQNNYRHHALTVAHSKRTVIKITYTTPRQNHDTVTYALSIASSSQSSVFALNLIIKSNSFYSTTLLLNCLNCRLHLRRDCGHTRATFVRPYQSRTEVARRLKCSRVAVVTILQK